MFGSLPSAGADRIGRDRIRSRLPLKQEKVQDGPVQIISGKVPWVPSTPTTRLPNAKAEQTTGTEKGLPLPPPPVLKPPPAPPVAALEEPLTDEEKQKLTHLRGLKGCCTLPESLQQEMQTLEAREAKVSMDKEITHGHINKRDKLKTQIQNITGKIQDLTMNGKPSSKAS